MAKGIIIDIGFDSDIKSYLNKLESELRKVNFDEMIGLSKSFDKEYKKVSELVKAIRGEVDSLSNADTTKINKQLEAITANSQKLTKAFAALYAELPSDSQARVNGFAEINNDLQDLIQLGKDASNTIKGIKDTTKGKVEIVNRDAEDRLKNAFKLLKDLNKELEDPKKLGGYQKSQLNDLSYIVSELVKNYDKLDSSVIALENDAT